MGHMRVRYSQNLWQPQSLVARKHEYCDANDYSAQSESSRESSRIISRTGSAGSRYGPVDTNRYQCAPVRQNDGHWVPLGN